MDGIVPIEGRQQGDEAVARARRAGTPPSERTPTPGSSQTGEGPSGTTLCSVWTEGWIRNQNDAARIQTGAVAADGQL